MNANTPFEKLIKKEPDSLCYEYFIDKKKKDIADFILIK